MRRLVRRQPPAPAREPAWDPLDRVLLERPERAGPVSEHLHGRVTGDDLAAMRAALSGGRARRAGGGRARLAAAVRGLARRRPRRRRAGAYRPVRRRAAGACPRDPARQPPRRRRAHYADRFVEVLGDPGQARAVLDFGCSSGRLIRALAPVYPEVRWHGCDPIAGAVAWAAEHFPQHERLHSALDPPLPYEDGRFDVVLALSIWSHFAEEPARAWLDEMHRVLAPGGRLVLTTHGFQTLRHLAERGQWAREDLERALRALYRTGFYYHDVFGEGGDWGVPRGERWGWAYISPAWMATYACPPWLLAEFRPGYIDDFQDVTVLQRALR